MYYGERSKVRGYMTELGFGCEDEVGTAEHILDCVSRVVGADAEAEKQSEKRIETIAAAADRHAREWVSFDAAEGAEAQQVERKMKHIVDLTTTHPGTNIFRQFKLLFGRSIQETLRGKAAIIIKVVQQVSLGLIYGGIYTLGDNQVSLLAVTNRNNHVPFLTASKLHSGKRHGSVWTPKSHNHRRYKHGNGRHYPIVSKGKVYCIS
jgi:hypothetical protein